MYEDEHLEADYEDRQNGGMDVDPEDEEDWIEPDPEVAERRAILMEVMERHPDMAFTGESVQDYIYGNGELESAGEEINFDEY